MCVRACVRACVCVYVYIVHMCISVMCVCVCISVECGVFVSFMSFMYACWCVPLYNDVSCSSFVLQIHWTIHVYLILLGSCL